MQIDKDGEKTERILRTFAKQYDNCLIFNNVNHQAGLEELS